MLLRCLLVQHGLDLRVACNMRCVVEGQNGVFLACCLCVLLPLLLLLLVLVLALRGSFIHGVVLGGRSGVLDELVHVEARLEQAVVHLTQGVAEPVVLRAIGGCVVQSVGELGDESLWCLWENAGRDPQDQLLRVGAVGVEGRD